MAMVAMMSGSRRRMWSIHPSIEAKVPVSVCLESSEFSVMEVIDLASLGVPFSHGSGEGDGVIDLVSNALV